MSQRINTPATRMCCACTRRGGVTKTSAIDALTCERAALPGMNGAVRSVIAPRGPDQLADLVPQGRQLTRYGHLSASDDASMS